MNFGILNLNTNWEQIEMARETEHITDEYVTEQIANGNCTPTLCEEMQSFIDDIANAIMDGDDTTADELAEQWLGD